MLHSFELRTLDYSDGGISDFDVCVRVCQQRCSNEMCVQLNYLVKYFLASY